MATISHLRIAYCNKSPWVSWLCDVDQNEASHRVRYSGLCNKSPLFVWMCLSWLGCWLSANVHTNTQTHMIYGISTSFLFIFTTREFLKYIRANESHKEQVNKQLNLQRWSTICTLIIFAYIVSLNITAYNLSKYLMLSNLHGKSQLIASDWKWKFTPKNWWQKIFK